MSLGAVSPMPRIVGPSSAIVAGVHVPSGVRSVPSVIYQITHTVPRTTGVRINLHQLPSSQQGYFP